MTRFRTRLAGQCGEKAAVEHGFDRLPVDPFAIAEAHDLPVVAKPVEVEGVSGGIVLGPGDPFIFYATNIRSPGFQRFTVAHELGHALLDGHWEVLEKEGPMHVSRAGFCQGHSSVEIEADHFAAGLLMPRRLIRQALRAAPIGLEGAREIEDRAQCSLTAAAIRMAECADHAVAAVVSQGDAVRYAFLSEPFKRLRPRRWLRKGEPLPDGLTRSFNANPANVEDRAGACGSTTLDAWFGGGELPLDEEVIGLGTYGRTLTVLSSEAVEADPDEENEERDLEEDWTPRFAYGR